MIPWRILAVVVVAAVSSLEAAPKESPTPRPPPMPQTQTISIFRGRSVEIPLRAVGRAPTQLKFLIRSQPRYGRLGEIRFTGRKTAVVTYYHDEKSTDMSDSFTFAVQAIDTAVSAPGTVNIAISEEPPALAVIHTLDFGRLWIGETHEEEIAIRNTGGGALSGRMIVSEPWRIVGSPDYNLARQEEKKVRLLFAPASSGEFVARLLFSHDSRSSVALTGGAAAPLEFEPSQEIELVAAVGETVRAGTVKIRNLTPEERTVDLSVPEAIEAPEDIILAPKGETAVVLRTKPGFSEHLEDRVDTLSDGYQRSLPLRVVALPALLRAEPAKGLDFGSVTPRTASRKTLVLRNDGGSSARLRVDVPREVLIIPDPNSQVLRPGEKRTFEVSLELYDSGPFREPIVVQSSTESSLNIEVTANGVGSVERPAQERPPVVKVTVGRDPAAGLPPRVFEEDTSPGTYNDIPPAKDFESRPLSPRAVEISWPKPAPNAAGAILEFRDVEVSKSGDARSVWRKWAEAKIKENGGRYTATLENLPPGRTWSFRIVSLDSGGGRSKPSTTLGLATPRAEPFPWQRWLIGLLIIAGAAYAIVLVRRRREAEARADEDRLTQLGRH